MGLHLIGSNDPDNLLKALTRFLAGAEAQLPPGDERVLAELPVIVPDRARRDWLREGIARETGICAGVRICLHNEFMEQVLAPALGMMNPRWDPAAARARVLPHLAEIPALHAALGKDREGALGARAWNLSGELIDGFDRIALHRLEHQGVAAKDMGEAIRSLGGDQPWRSELWQRIAGDAVGDPVRWQRDLEGAIAANAHRLPPRLAVVESSGPSQAAWRIFSALAVQCDVLLLGITPTWGDWDWVRRWAEADADADSASPGEGLLASWGTAARRVAATALAAGATDLRLEALSREPVGTGLLVDLQRALLHPDQPPARAARDEASPPGTRTLTFHDAIGIRRQLEVVRHKLARIFADDPSIAVHEVAILCPDPQAVEGLARAIFGSSGEGPPIDIQHRLQQRPEEDALEVALRLAELLPSRWPASAVLDLLGHPLVQIHHPCDLQRVRRWLDHADVRWGVDAQHQQELGVPCTGLGTWRRGLLRLELAAWHGEDVSTAKRWVGEMDDPGVVPAGGIQEEDIPLIRALAELLGPLLDAAARWRSTHQPHAWCEDLDRLLDGLIGSGHERSGPRQVLNAWRGGFAASASIPEMRADVLRAVIADGIRRPGVRLRGGLTLGSVSELGGLPWRVVALIGMDDGAFPRQIVLRDLDPLAVARHGNDPDPRADDRLRLLQTVCTVRDHLVVAWSGRESIKGEVLPSAPVIQELIEVVAKLTHRPVEHLVIHHRLHAAHERPASWPSAALREQAAAFAMAQRHADDGAPRPQRPLPRAEVTTLEIGEFLSTWKNPPAAFLRALGLSLRESMQAPRDFELFDMEGLDRWQLDQRIFAGENIDQLTAEGVLPPPPFSLAEFGQRQHKNRAVGAWWASVQGRLTQMRIDITCAGVQVVGVLGDILPGIGPVLARTSKPGARHLLDHALRTLIWRVAASQTGGGLVACSGTKKMPVEVCQWSYRNSRGGDQGLLQEMVAFTLRARCQPLPIMPELASAMLASIDAPPTYQGSIMDEAELVRSGREFWLSDLQEHHPGANERSQESCRRLWPDGESIFADCVLTRELIGLLAPFLSAQAWSPGQVEP